MHARMRLSYLSLKCLKSLFEPFMLGIERAKGGDFSEHVVVVANGVAAYLYCDAMRHVYKHHCVLDRICAPPHAPPEFAGHPPSSASEPLQGEQPKDPIQTVVYWLGMSNRIHWASKISIRSEVWSDRDCNICPPFSCMIGGRSSSGFQPSASAYSRRLNVNHAFVSCWRSNR
eukprot:363075-Chlamydomonas_euryale.AAC.2